MKTRCLFFLILIVPLLWSQEKDMNFNDYYQFPFSIGVEYQSLQPLNAYDEDYNIFDIAVDFRYPLPKRPTIQPFLKAGISNLDSLDQDLPDKWDHNQFYSMLGLGYTNRFAKNFELGADIQGGIGEAVFPNAVDAGSVGAFNLLLAASAKITLDPSYAYSIDIRPSLRYQRSLAGFNKYDGVLLGLGFGVNFRFGEDPDSAGAIIRNLRFDELIVEPVFSAMQSYYVQNPIGKVTLTNTSRNSLSDIQLSFFQAGFMDSSTVAAQIPSLDPGETVTVGLLASYNQQIFTTNGITPLTGEVIAEYNLKSRPVEQRESVTYDLHDKTAIAWDDDRKVGAFITPADSALQNYVSFIRKATREESLTHYNEPLQLAMQIYEALIQAGMIYQIDPISPFTKAQEDSFVVDSVKLSRDTLTRGTGDCDDLTVLFCSLLESAGIETGFITVPGHIYPVVNTGYASRKFRDVHPDRNLTIDVDGELWVPVEITMIGRSGFLEAWRRGTDLWHSYDQDTAQRGFFRTRESQLVYRPVGLRESDLGLQYGNPESLASAFEATLSKLAGTITTEYDENARNSGDKRDFNKAGLANARFGFFNDAENAFNRALRLDPEFLPAQINLGNIAYMRRSFSRAIKEYQDAYQVLSDKGLQESITAANLLINLSKASYAQENFPEAQTFFAQVQEFNPDLAMSHAYLGSSDGTARASDISSADRIIFIEE